MTSFRSQLGPVLLLTAIFFLNFISRIILAPLMPAVERELAISHTEAGSLFFFLSTGYFVSLISASFISSRLTHRKTILLSAFGTGTTLVALSHVHSFAQLRAGFLVLGLASGLYLPSGIATLTALVQKQHWGKGLAVHELAPNLAFVTAPLIAEGLMGWLPWQKILGFVGAFAIFAGVIFAGFGKGGRFKGEAPRLSSIQVLLKTGQFWMMVTLFGLAIGGSMGVYAILPLYLVAEKGMERDWTNTLIAISRISGLVMGFAAGWATDRFKAPFVISTVLLLTGIFTFLLGMVPGQSILIFVFLQPMLAVCFFPAGFAALSSMAGPATRNIAVSLTVPFSFLLGAGAIPAIIGWLGDVRSFALGISIFGGGIFLGCILSLFLRPRSGY